MLSLLMASSRLLLKTFFPSKNKDLPESVLRSTYLRPRKLIVALVQWHCYNLIRPDDLLKASAIRRVTTASATGTTSSSRVHMTLQIRVKSLDFDPQSSQLHVSGRVVAENQYTKIGQHHTLDLELQRNFTLEKRVESSSEAGGWDSIAIDMLKEAVDEGGNRRAEAVAVVMQEGLAHICFIGQFQTVLKQKIELSIPRKRQGGLDRDKVNNNRYAHNWNRVP